MTAKFDNFNLRIQHNYNYSKKVTFSKLYKTSFPKLNKMEKFYQINIENCLCSDNKLATSNFGIDVPCFHRLHLGASFQNLDELNIPRIFQYYHLKIDYDFLPKETNPAGEDVDEKKIIYSKQ